MFGAFGCVVMEMYTGQPPNPKQIPIEEQTELITSPVLKHLVLGCTRQKHSERLSMKDVKVVSINQFRH